MRARQFVMVMVILAGLLLLASCQGAAPRDVLKTVVVEKAVEAVEEHATQAPPKEEKNTSDEENDYSAGVQAQTDQTYTNNRMIIKNAEMRLEVENTDVSVDRITQVVEDVGGYIVSSRSWYQTAADGQIYKYATLTMGVPVQEFERSLRRLREISLKVLDEMASGEDVTDDYVDLQSRLKNLQTTRDRIRDFMAQATTVEEALKVNEQLSEVEAEIEQIQGQMNYLFDRAAYSTITVNIEPKVLLPTLTPTPTATPTPTPTAWSPVHTFKRASSGLGTILRGLTDFFIWVIVILVPIFGPPALLVFWILRMRQRKIRAKNNPKISEEEKP